MTRMASKNWTDAIHDAVAGVQVDQTHHTYWAQNEFVVLKEFLPKEIVEDVLGKEVARLKSGLNRNFIPGHKKGGSVSYYTVREHAPPFLALYRSHPFLDLLRTITEAPVTICPDHDPHSCALYYYTEPGDHIGFHYDTSYYQGARYTILMGLVDRSSQCQLVCHLYKDDPNRATQELRFATAPGDMVIFNGDKLWHAVTPLAEGEERVVLTMEYVTNPHMNPLKRLYSNLKDAFGYFGIRAVFKGTS